MLLGNELKARIYTLSIELLTFESGIVDCISFIKNEITNEFGATRLLSWYLGLKCSVFQMGKKIF